MPTVMVGGAVANKYLNGGEAWVRLSWVLGLARLGYDVCFVEQIAASSCVSLRRRPRRVRGLRQPALLRLT